MALNLISNPNLFFPEPFHLLEMGNDSLDLGRFYIAGVYLPGVISQQGELPKHGYVLNSVGRVHYLVTPFPTPSLLYFLDWRCKSEPRDL